jgi:hypothetical protein
MAQMTALRRRMIDDMTVRNLASNPTILRLCGCQVQPFFRLFAGPDGLAAIAYRDGNQVVVAFRGTVADLVPNLVADTSWGTTTPNGVFATYVNDAAVFLASVHANNPNASITLTGHSLGAHLQRFLVMLQDIPALPLMRQDRNSLSRI